ncbi:MULTISPECIES: PfkB family carbohydrate kinase [unclassified Thermosipho (in: thermotogales)]|uniref:1-phosphofructokinase family hexose kinase n=1 Tax=unclassified Thermosipho (in: thermotogales) TaxID=2676525 RepID=UPI000985EE48|nr:MULTISPECIES: PfkB family carbohydrate kinase [unclassified Thermosipho (in: thermotogales)]MBT1247790.1 ribokinase [Thermosipho sp. 1244]OOC47013.1 ribokinase [Thermosipho sp. 1223]
MSVLAVCLNPALDREFYINNFTVNKLHRLEPEFSRMSPGGKSINVAIDLSSFGVKSIVTGFIGGYVGDIVLSELRNISNLITTNFVHIENETRENIVIVDEENHTLTELNSAGPRIPIEDINHFLRRYTLIVPSSDAVVISGSIPQGVPVQFYGDLTKIAKKHGKRVFWETRDEISRESIKIDAPCIIRPDFRKDKVLFGKELESEQDYIDGGKELIRYGVKMAVLSYKIDYDIIVTSDGVWFIKPLVEIDHAHLLGTGDTYMAAMVYKCFETEDLIEIAKFGYAAALAKTWYKAKVPPKFEDIEKASTMFKIERVE